MGLAVACGKIARRQVLVAMHGDTRFVMVFWG